MSGSEHGSTLASSVVARDREAISATVASPPKSSDFRLPIDFPGPPSQAPGSAVWLGPGVDWTLNRWFYYDASPTDATLPLPRSGWMEPAQPNG